MHRLTEWVRTKATNRWDSGNGGSDIGGSAIGGSATGGFGNRPALSPMLYQVNPSLVRRARFIGAAASLIALCLSLAIPFGWITHIVLFRSQLPTAAPAHVLASILSALLDISVFLLYRGWWKKWDRVICWIVAICSGIVLLEYFTPGELPFVNFARFLDPSPDFNKIAPNGAWCLWCTSIAALLVSAKNPKLLRFGQSVAILGGLVAAVALIGYAYTIQPFYHIGDYSRMSVPGALNYVLIATAVFLVVPEQGLTRIVMTRSPAGVMSRRLYTAVLIVPPVLGFLALMTSVIWRWYDISFAIALLTMAIILLFVAIVGFTSVRLERADQSRLRAESDLLHSHDRLRKLSNHMQTMQEEERVRIAREVHDDLGQSLTALKMDVALLRNKLPLNEEVERRTNSMLQLVNATIKSVQRISTELRPSILDDLGLGAAIEWQAHQFGERSGIPTSIRMMVDPGLTSAVATALFRVLQETLTNIARHAHATAVTITLSEKEENICLRVEDNGVGFDERNLSNVQSLGLMGMRERLQLLDGSLIITGKPGEGTVVTAMVPRNKSIPGGDDSTLSSPSAAFSTLPLNA
jgi:signal transduction histidine kinase